MEWKEVDIEQTSIEIIDGDRGKNYPKNNELTNSGYCLFLSAANVTKNGLQFSNNSFITKEKDALLRKGKLMPQDIVLTTRGTVGNVGFYGDDVPYSNMRINSGMVIIRPGEDFDTLFLYLYLRSCYFRAQITQFQSGSAQPQLPISTLQKMKVIKPDIAAQRRIASILSSLDRKIELNNKINADLEEMAQAIFKNWFVDFEPFKDGKFVDSELGMIPEGWKVGTLADIAEITMGQSPAGNSLNENREGMIFYQGSSDFGFRFPSIRVFTTEPKRLAVANSVLFSVRAPVGDINVAKEECCIGRGVASIKSKYGHDSYLFYTMKSLHKLFDSFDGEGTVFGSINKKTLSAIQILLPSDGIVEQFNNIASSFDDRIRSLSDENSRLSLLRDTLLPRLMSGELEVPE
ncbi:restriction endonuclease subunit S [Segatella sp.]|uniref:restriction endonuclease subunit S n=1 Tax=Segatella sp. TaxID=2974253 RepID=UPI00307CD5D6